MSLRRSQTVEERKTVFLSDLTPLHIAPLPERIALDMRPLTASPARTALPAAHFDRNERHAYFGDRTLNSMLRW
jgi:hypothetical protein